MINLCTNIIISIAVGMIMLGATLFVDTNKAKYMTLCIGIILIVLIWLFHFSYPRTPAKSKVKAEENPQPSPLNPTEDHKSILQQFKIHDPDHLSAEDIEHSTGIDPFKTQSILDKLVFHKLILATNYDDLNGGWLYILSDEGRIFINRNLT
ncbi:MAG TPA: hypothetical protein VMW42_06480 [Desulfatiglandales bacterium]|nr:hypothetical protein [Desulfatiglandales bacterium]